MTHVAWLRAALDDLRGIHAYIALDNPAAASRVVKAVRDDVKVRQDHPAIGRPGRIEGSRELVIGHFPYIVAYRQAVTRVEILAVLHSSRRWPEQLS
jgi:addiction module RelE/StbE family toxin